MIHFTRHTFSLTRVALFLGALFFFSSCYKADESAPSSPEWAPSPSPSSTIPIRWPEHHFVEGLQLVVAQELVDDLPNEYNEPDQDNIFVQLEKSWDESIPDRVLFHPDFIAQPNVNHQDLEDYRNGDMGIYFSEDWFDDVSPTALAVTQFFGTRRNIGTSNEYIELSHSDIVLNMSFNDLVWDNNEQWGYDIPSIILHELGHFLGLPHEQTNDAAVMQPFLNSWTQYREIFDADKAAIRHLYPELDEQGQQEVESQPDHFIMAAVSTGDSSGPTQKVRGIIELQKDGECRHYLDGKLVHTHQKDIP